GRAGAARPRAAGAHLVPERALRARAQHRLRAGAAAAARPGGARQGSPGAARGARPGARGARARRGGAREGTVEVGVAKAPSIPASERVAPLEMSPEEFRAAGHALVDRIAEFLASIRSRPVTPGEAPAVVRAALGQGALPEHGVPAATLLERAAPLLFDHSLLNGHPRFFGYITSSAAPLGALGDLLAAAVNPNCGAWELSPIASEIEAQSVRWIAALIGYPAD